MIYLLPMSNASLHALGAVAGANAVALRALNLSATGNTHALRADALILARNGSIVRIHAESIAIVPKLEVFFLEASGSDIHARCERAESEPIPLIHETETCWQTFVIGRRPAVPEGHGRRVLIVLMWRI